MLVAPVSAMAESLSGMGALKIGKFSKLSLQRRRQRRRKLSLRFGGGLWVGIFKPKEFAATTEPNLIILFSHPSCQKSQSSQPLLIFPPGPAGLARVAVVTGTSCLSLQLELLCPARTPWPYVHQKPPTFHLFLTEAWRIRILFSVSRWSEGREPVLVPAVLLEVGVTVVAAGVAAVASERFVRAAVIYVYCLVVAAARWSRAALLLEDAAASVSNGRPVAPVVPVCRRRGRWQGLRV